MKNQRVIKFRQWANNKFFYWGIGLEDTTFIGPVSGGTINAKNTVHQQFTGLLDRNGKEIYEGDIVQVEGTKKIGSYITSVIFKAPQFKLARNDTYWHDYASFCSAVVIGNIYENPDRIAEKAKEMDNVTRQND